MKKKYVLHVSFITCSHLHLKWRYWFGCFIHRSDQWLRRHGTSLSGKRFLTMAGSLRSLTLMIQKHNLHFWQYSFWCASGCFMCSAFANRRPALHHRNLHHWAFHSMSVESAATILHRLRITYSYPRLSPPTHYTPWTSGRRWGQAHRAPPLSCASRVINKAG